MEKNLNDSNENSKTPKVNLSDAQTMMKRNQSINEMTAANRIYCNSFSTRENRDLLETTINLLI